MPYSPTQKINESLSLYDGPADKGWRRLVAIPNSLSLLHDGWRAVLFPSRLPSTMPQTREEAPRHSHHQARGVRRVGNVPHLARKADKKPNDHRSEEHTSELQS